jgi:hypothetical protein
MVGGGCEESSVRPLERVTGLRQEYEKVYRLSPPSMQSFCMQHQVTWSAPLAAIDNRPSTDDEWRAGMTWCGIQEL